MTVFQKHFSGKTILLAFILETVPYQAPFLLSFSDASIVACGAYLVGTEEVAHRMWSSSEAEKSSKWRELKAVHFALTSFKNSVQGKTV